MTRPLRTREVAKLLGTSPEAVHKLVQTGKLKANRRGNGKHLEFDTQSVAGEMTARSARKRGRRR